MKEKGWAALKTIHMREPPWLTMSYLILPETGLELFCMAHLLYRLMKLLGNCNIDLPSGCFFWVCQIVWAYCHLNANGDNQTIMETIPK